MKQHSGIERISTPAPGIDIATLELLARWKAEDATKDPEAIRAAEHELAEFKKTMNKNRSESGESLLFS